MTAAAVPYGVAMISELEFAFLVDVDGETLVMTPYEFACHDAACRPPGSGGTGGSEPGSKGGADGQFRGGGHGTVGGGGTRKIGEASHVSDMKELMGDTKKEFHNHHVNADGTLGVPYVKPGAGGTVEYDAKQQAKVDKQLAALGVTHEALVHNLIENAKGAIEAPGAQAAIKWYDTEHQWGATLSKEYGVSEDRVFGMTSLLSAMRKWGVEGVGTNGSSTNKGAVETILKLLKKDEPFEITAKMAADFNGYVGKKANLGKGSTIEPGMYKPSDLSSSSLSRLVGGNGLNLKIMNLAGSKPIARAIALARGELSVNEVVRGTKQRSFVSNLTHPEIDYTSTNDLWHYRAVAGKNEFNFSDRRKNEDGSPSAPKNSKVRTTLAEYENHVTGYVVEDGRRVPTRANQPHDIFSGSEPTGGLYSYVTRVTKDALDSLKSTDVRFKGMKIHEFQALVWKYAGGNAGAGGEE